MASLNGTWQENNPVLPEDTYTLCVTASEAYVTGSGENAFRFTLQVIGGDYDGNSFSLVFCPFHSNPTAANAAKQGMTRLFKACGFTDEPNDTEDIHNIEFSAIVGPDKTGDYNRIKRYLEVTSPVSEKQERNWRSSKTPPTRKTEISQKPSAHTPQPVRRRVVPSEDRDPTAPDWVYGNEPEN